ncbi:MAG: response regulator transcription factor [Spirochaetales bacterium]|nr:response regulator transcription factor [Spirochaetales bacterium]
MPVCNKVRINIVSDDQLLIEKINYYFKQREDIQFEYSHTPVSEENVEIYIAPVSCAMEMNARNNRESVKPPVIFYGDPSFLRKAFLAGCVDYLKDPWTVDELAFRLERIIRETKKIFTFSWGSISFIGTDIVSGKSRCSLLYQEYRILKLLLQQRGNAVPREVLFYSLWNHPGPRQSRVIDVHISSIRKKLRLILPGDYHEEVIISSRGVGYMIK